ncbi:MAG: spermidine/putrescine ABC transporter substrate-binding protein [Sphingomonadaceae bacterium]|uniref:polyamine ABC transporter substrate-binding protein n=1 Tax=Thermaurantiacus sp. TaxID=2820283 RepID=UPI00298EDF68|nr:spermidine/putrescine ABC transporter substrate-binding protein [Thermaurantiacus sp.]MCS6986881.1 spermidine/putrescine ABC transporter substrate-binding protein [Sphingomonadaceae bacterium]MDW8415519.1 spermidine/putrescine ABC transporter substrate-binding protein [Thermaurantiacus sp.]
MRFDRRRLLGGAGALALSLTACGRAERRLYFYNWDTYIGATTLDDFRAATGVRVVPSFYATNDELFAKLRAGNPGYDVIVPSNEFVTRMRLAGMLQPLDLSRIPNLRNIAPEFLTADYDPEPRHSVPYTWLVSGIGYRRSKVDGVPDSWKWLFDSDRYAGRIALVAEAADLIRLGAKYLGRSLVGVDEATARAVAALLIRQKPRIRAFHDDNGQDLLLAGDVDLALEYNGDMAQAIAEDPDLAFVVPREGSLLNADTLAIPKGAPSPDLAHEFINFLLDAEVGAGIARTILYPTPNAAARARMPDRYRTNPVIFPSGPGMAASEWGRFEGPERWRLFDELVTAVRAA